MLITSPERKRQLLQEYATDLWLERLIQSRHPSHVIIPDRAAAAWSRRGLVKAVLAGSVAVGTLGGLPRSAAASPLNLLVGLSRAAIQTAIRWVSPAAKEAAKLFLAWSAERVLDWVVGKYAIGASRPLDNATVTRYTGQIQTPGFSVTNPITRDEHDVTVSSSDFERVRQRALEMWVGIVGGEQPTSRQGDDLPIGSMMIVNPRNGSTYAPAERSRVACVRDNDNWNFTIPRGVTLSYEGRVGDWVQVFHPEWESVGAASIGGRATPKAGPGFFYMPAWNLRWFEGDNTDLLAHTDERGTRDGEESPCKPQNHREQCPA